MSILASEEKTNKEKQVNLFPKQPTEMGCGTSFHCSLSQLNLVVNNSSGGSKISQMEGANRRTSPPVCLNHPNPSPPKNNTTVVDPGFSWGEH